MDSYTSADWVNSGLGTGGTLVGFAIYIVFVVALWKVFTKAGRPGILSIIPIVNLFVLVSIAGFSKWLGLLYLIPVVGFVFNFFVALRLGRGFGTSTVFAVVLLWIFPPIGMLIVGFGDARYNPRALESNA